MFTHTSVRRIIKHTSLISVPLMALLMIFSVSVRKTDAQVAQESADQNMFAGSYGQAGASTKPIPAHSVIVIMGYGSDDTDGLFSATYGSFITSGPDKGKVQKEGHVYQVCSGNGRGTQGAINSLREDTGLTDYFPNSPQSSWSAGKPLDYFLSSWGWYSSTTSGGTPTSDGCGNVNASSPTYECAYVAYQTYDPVTLQLTGSPTYTLPNGQEAGDCVTKGYDPQTMLRRRLVAPPGKFLIAIEHFGVAGDASTAGISGTRRGVSGFSGPPITPSFTVSSTVDHQVVRDNGTGDGKNFATYDIALSNCQNLTAPVQFSNPDPGSITGVTISFVGNKSTATCNPGDNIVSVVVNAGANASPARGASSTVVDQIITTASSPGATSTQVPMGITIYGRPNVTMTGGAFATTDNAVIGWHTDYVYSSVNFHGPCGTAGEWSGYKSGGDNATFSENLGTLSAGNHNYSMSCPGALGTFAAANATIQISNAARGSIEVNYYFDNVKQSSPTNISYSITDQQTTNTIVPNGSRVIPNTSTVPFDLNNLYWMTVTDSQNIGSGNYVLDYNTIFPTVEPQADGTNKLIFDIYYYSREAKDFAMQVVSTNPNPSNIMIGQTVVVTVQAINCVGLTSGITIQAVDDYGNANFTPTSRIVAGCNIPTTFTYTGNTPGLLTLSFVGNASGVNGDRWVQLPVNVYNYPQVRTYAVPATGYAPLVSSIRWTSSYVDTTKQCELYADGVPTGEASAYYGHQTDGSGNWSGYGGQWSLYYSGTGSQGWTKEVAIGGITQRVHFQVSNQPQVLWVGSDSASERSWFIGGESAYFKINAGPTYANKEVLWSTYNGGSTYGIRDASEVNKNYKTSGIILDANGHWEGYSPYANPLNSEPNYGGWRTREIKIINPGDPVTRPLLTAYISYTHTATKPVFTMDRTFYRTTDVPFYEVTGAKPNSKVYWSSYFNNRFYGMVPANNTGDVYNSNALNGGPLTMQDYAYAYRVKCFGPLNTWGDHFVQVVLSAPAATASVTYTLDGVAQSNPASFNYHIDSVATGQTVINGTSAPYSASLPQAGQYNFFYDNGAPTGYAFDKITTPISANVSNPGTVTFNVNFKTVMGKINVVGTVDGNPTTSSLNYSLNGPTAVGAGFKTLPQTHTGILPGSYTLVINGLPANTALDSILPSATQTLNSAQEITYTVAMHSTNQDFSLTVTPLTSTERIPGSGTPITYRVAVTCLNGFAGPATNLRADRSRDSFGSNTTFSFGTTSVACGANTTLTVNVNAGTPANSAPGTPTPGNFTILADGSGVGGDVGYGVGVRGATGQITVYPAPTATLTANPNPVTSGQSTTLTYGSTNTLQQSGPPTYNCIIYNGTNQTYPSPDTIVSYTGASGTQTTPTLTADTNYWLRCFGAIGSYADSGIVNVTVTGGNPTLSNSNKRILAINGVTNTGANSNFCDPNQTLVDSNLTARLGQPITFLIDICNSAAVGNDLTLAGSNNLVITDDQMTHLVKPTTGWNVTVQGNACQQAPGWSSASGSAPQCQYDDITGGLRITLRNATLAANGGLWKVTFVAKTNVTSSENGSTFFYRNKGTITYPSGSKVIDTGFKPFVRGSDDGVKLIEIPPGS